MDLVLFEQAIEHVCRILASSRTLPATRCSLALVALKQSLSKLASFICGYETVRLSMSATFGVADFLEVLAEMLKKAHVKGVATTFLLTDSQIVDEKFLVSLNNLLASWFVPGVFPKDEMDGIFSGLRNEAKAAGVTDAGDHDRILHFARAALLAHCALLLAGRGHVPRARASSLPSSTTPRSTGSTTRGRVMLWFRSRSASSRTSSSARTRTRRTLRTTWQKCTCR